MRRPDVCLSDPELFASCHAPSLGPLRPVYDFKLDRLALVESSKTVPLNSRKMNKNVTADFLFDKSIAFGIIEPLDLAVMPIVFRLLTLRMCRLPRSQNP